MLDWTKNPLIAVYFAVSSSPLGAKARVYAHQAQSVVDTDRTKSPFEVTEVSAYFPSAVVPRIVSQKGLFTVHPLPREPLSVSNPNKHAFDIDAEDRPYFQRRLFDLGVDPSSVRADVDGICQTLEWQFRQNVALGKFTT